MYKIEGFSLFVHEHTIYLHQGYIYIQGNLSAPLPKIYRKKFEKSEKLYFFNHLLDTVSNDIHKLKIKFENIVIKKKIGR